MNDSLIKQLAEAAGLGFESKSALDGERFLPSINEASDMLPELRAFVLLIEKHEREQCAQVCESIYEPVEEQLYPSDYAAAIRKRME